METRLKRRLKGLNGLRRRDVDFRIIFLLFERMVHSVAAQLLDFVHGALV